MDIEQENKILITCSRGNRPFLEKEVEGLGMPIESSHETGLVTRGRFVDTYGLNLELRTAYNVLFLLREFRCVSPDHLYKEAFQIPWEAIIPEGEYISVVSQVDNPTIRNSMFANQKLKDAIVDRMMKKTGKRPDAGPDRNNIVLNLYWKKDNAWIYINTSGNKLADRGYRKIPYIAPMQETLAAAVVMATGYDGTSHFVNPMCGSGTLAIEAALVALDKAPGLLRSNYGLTHLKDFSRDYWQSLRKEVLSRSGKRTNFRIVATDHHPGAVDAARKNATTAGVDHLIDFKVCDFAETEVPEGQGVVILNPEYGERMGNEEELAGVYKGIGDFFKKSCKGYAGYIFTGNAALARKVGLRSEKRLPFYSGEIECRLLEYQIF
jgi:putative N6-adenine-specific DNA methylase